MANEARPQLQLVGAEQALSDLRRQQQEFDGGGGGGYDGRMEERVKRLETLMEKTQDRLVVIERDVAVIRSNYATKEDLHKELHATTWKIIAAIAALCGAVFWLARNVEPTKPPLTSFSAPAAPAPAAPPAAKQSN